MLFIVIANFSCEHIPSFWGWNITTCYIKFYINENGFTCAKPYRQIRDLMPFPELLSTKNFRWWQWTKFGKISEENFNRQKSERIKVVQSNDIIQVCNELTWSFQSVEGAGAQPLPGHRASMTARKTRSLPANSRSSNILPWQYCLALALSAMMAEDSSHVSAVDSK